jgi:hypothetical protein
MTATNSFTVLDLCNELVRYKPDLFIVYDGHNEFYGALGVASNEGVASSRWMTMLYLRLIHFRTFHFVKEIVSGLSGIFGESSVDYSNRATMMEQVAKGKSVPYMSDTYTKCFDTFHENLAELAELCKNEQELNYLFFQHQ